MKDFHSLDDVATELGIDLDELRREAGHNECGWWVGPIWKLDGETCVCVKPADHPELDHRCSCGSWFAGCGHAPGERVAS